MIVDQRTCFRAAICNLAVLIVASIAFVVPARAQNKYAFVVGIDRYDHLPVHAQLKKAVGDARAVGKTLAELGYNVTPVIEPTRGLFVTQWYQFLDQIRPGDTIAFVFSGHGVELEGANYLLPRDVPRVRSGREGVLRSESLSFWQLLTDMLERKPAFSFVVLDACRDNPFSEGGRTVGGRRGLVQVEALEGTFVMFSAGAGQTALDRLNDSDQVPTSVFTRTLLPLLRRPGLSLLEMADEVGEQVRALARTAGHKQTPAFYSRVIGGRHVCMAGCSVSLPPEPQEGNIPEKQMGGLKQESYAAESSAEGRGPKATKRSIEFSIPIGVDKEEFRECLDENWRGVRMGQDYTLEIKSVFVRVLVPLARIDLVSAAYEECRERLRR